MTHYPDEFGHTGIIINGREVLWKNDTYYLGALYSHSIDILRKEAAKQSTPSPLPASVHIMLNGKMVRGTYRGMSKKKHGLALVTINGEKDSVYADTVFRLLSDDEITEFERLDKALIAAANAREDYYRLLPYPTKCSAGRTTINTQAMTATITVNTDAHPFQVEYTASFNRDSENWECGSLRHYSLRTLVDLVAHDAHPDNGKQAVSVEGVLSVFTGGGFRSRRLVIDGWSPEHYRSLISQHGAALKAMQEWSRKHRLEVS